MNRALNLTQESERNSYFPFLGNVELFLGPNWTVLRLSYPFWGLEKVYKYSFFHFPRQISPKSKKEFWTKCVISFHGIFSLFCGPSKNILSIITFHFSRGISLENIKEFGTGRVGHLKNILDDSVGDLPPFLYVLRCFEKVLKNFSSFLLDIPIIRNKKKFWTGCSKLLNFLHNSGNTLWIFQNITAV